MEKTSCSSSDKQIEESTDLFVACESRPMLWIEKHRPHRIEEVAGNPAAVGELRRWSLDWDRGRRRKPLLLHGPPGTGKSAACYAMAEELGWELVEMNASDLRNRENVERVVGYASISGGLFGRRRLVLIDEVDSFAGRKDRGGESAVVEILKGAEQPIALTATDLWDPALSHIRPLCQPVEFRRVTDSSIAKVLERILKEERIGADAKVIARIAGMSNGDLRSAIIDLQTVAEGRRELREPSLSVLTQRDRERDIWDALRTLFKTMSYAEASDVTWGVDVDPDMFMKWVDENIPNEYDAKEDLYRAFEALSRADIFAGRISSRQYWGFLRYANVLMTAGVALAKDEPYRKYAKYSFPHIIRELSRTKAERTRRRKIGLKMGAKVHVSSRDALNIFLPLIKALMEEGRVAPLADYFGFDIEDLAFILEKSEKQVERLLEKQRARTG